MLFMWIGVHKVIDLDEDVVDVSQLSFHKSLKAGRAANQM